MNEVCGARRLFAVLAILIWAAPAPAAEGSAASRDSGSSVLDHRALLRTFMVYRTPVVLGSDGKFKEPFVPRGHRGKILKKNIGKYQSPMPEDSWRSPDFDDSEWKRERVPVEKPQSSASGRRLTALHASTVNSIICARAKFVVEDPGAVGDLKLSVTYVGGIAAFLNGREVTRANLPEGELKPDTIAEKYPADLYLAADGKHLLPIAESMKAAHKRRFSRRYRRISDVNIPAARLRKGVNVLALQIFRAPVSEAAVNSIRRPYSGMFRVPGLWSTVALRGVSLKASGDSGFRANVGRRPGGIRVWNCQPFETLDLHSFGDPGSEPLPIEIDAVRCGAFSGRFVISSSSSITGLKVGMSELKSADGKSSLPADALRLRHGRRARPSETSRAGNLFDGLWDGVPSEVPVAKVSITRRRNRRRFSVNYSGAVLPVWITVRPAPDTKPGLYTGEVSVEAEDLKKTVLPLRVRVHGFTLPEPHEWRVRQLNIFSPYSLALHYKVPMWSEKHWKLIERSFRLMYEINARRVDVDMVPVLRALDAPVEHSMFRLVKKNEGEGFDYDFTVIDRLLDTVAKIMKKPLPLQVNCWGDDRSQDKKTGKTIAAWATGARRVPVRDPETGKITGVKNPRPGSNENYEFWEPILDQLRKKIEERKWFDVTAFGHQSYCYPPSPGQVDVARRIWPDGVYALSAHNGTLNGRFKGTKGATVPVRYSECVWTAGKRKHRGYRRLLKPGRDKSIWNYSFRNGHRDTSSLTTLLYIVEDGILRGHDGLGYMCSDFLPLETSRKGRYRLLSSRVGNVIGASTRSFLAAGPDGPIATGRYEMLREGSQQCETILFLQRALDAKKVDGELAGKVNRYLDQRSTAFLRHWHVNRRQSDRGLFELAAEVAGSIGQE